MFNLAGVAYPLVRMDVSDAYPTGTPLCDACHTDFGDGARCYHSSVLFGHQVGGFDVCQQCHDGIQFRDAVGEKSRARPAVGTRVKLVGLVNRPELNQAFGFVTEYPADARRVGVRLDGGTRSLSIHADNLLVQPHFLMVENDVLRILASSNASLKIDGNTETRRAVPLEELRSSDAHSVEIDGTEYMLRTESCAICMTASDSLRPFVGHPVRVCDKCNDALTGQPCPFCRSTTGDHTTRPTRINLVRLPLATRDVRFFVKVASLGKRYDILVTPTQLEIHAKFMNFSNPAVTYRGERTRSLGDACAAAITGNGASVTIRPPANYAIDMYESYTDEVAFDKVVAVDSILYRLSDGDDIHKSSEFVGGRTALQRAYFRLNEERVALAVCVVDPAGSKQYIYIFFSVNFRLPGIVALMPDPDGDVPQQCVSIADFYDPRYWCAQHPAVNHNDICAFRRFFAQ